MIYIAFFINHFHAILLVANRPTGTARMQNEGVQSTRVYGRPEIWYRNQWGTVCGRSGYGFDWRDATVICQMMGFGGRQWNTIAASTSLVPQGSGRVWLDYLSCSQYYEWITQCSHNGWGVRSACNNHRYDVALFCRSKQCSYYLILIITVQ